MSTLSFDASQRGEDLRGAWACRKAGKGQQVSVARHSHTALLSQHPTTLTPLTPAESHRAQRHTLARYPHSMR